MHVVWNWLLVQISGFKLPKSITAIDIIQIILIAWLVYHLILWVKNTKAYTLLKGILMIVAFIMIAYLFNMQTIIWLCGNLGSVAIIALVIVFQPELRRVVEQLGENNPLNGLNFRSSQDVPLRFSDQTINELVRAVFDMAEVKTGALIVIERNITLSEYEQTGIPVDAVLTSQLLVNIFEHNTPLHDGAVIVRNDRVVAATCYLPLSGNMDLSKTLGTRHRAGVGISERTDSFTLIVSEETGRVSYAVGGRLHTVHSPSDLREHLHQIQLVNAKKTADEKKMLSRKEEKNSFLGDENQKNESLKKENRKKEEAGGTET